MVRVGAQRRSASLTFPLHLSRYFFSYQLGPEGRGCYLHTRDPAKPARIMQWKRVAGFYVTALVLILFVGGTHAVSLLEWCELESAQGGGRFD